MGIHSAIKIGLEQHCWPDRRQDTLENPNLAYIKATVWACSEDMISICVLPLEILAFAFSSYHHLSLPDTFPTYLPHTGSFFLTWTLPAAAVRVTQLGPWLSHFSTNAFLECCKRLLHKSWVNYRQILSTPTLPEYSAKLKKKWGRERVMVYFWALRTAECQHLIQTQLPVISTHFSSFSLFRHHRHLLTIATPTETLSTQPPTH